MDQIKGTRRLRKQYRKVGPKRTPCDLGKTQFLNCTGANAFLHALVHCYIRGRMDNDPKFTDAMRESRAKLLHDFQEFVSSHRLDEIDGQRDKRGRDS